MVVGCTFIEQLENALNKVRCRNNLIVDVDFIVYFGSDFRKSKELVDLFESFGLVQLIHTAIRCNNFLDIVSKFQC